MSTNNETQPIINLVLQKLKNKQLEDLEIEERINKADTQTRYEEFIKLWEKITIQITKDPESSTFMDYLINYNDPRLFNVVQQISFLCYYEGYNKGTDDEIDRNMDI